MTLTRVNLKRFTAFSDLSLDLSRGINVFVGANGTGKTHLMKVCYAACEASRPDVHFMEKLVRVFLPSGRRPGRLAKRQVGRSRAVVEVPSLWTFYRPHSSDTEGGNWSESCP